MARIYASMLTLDGPPGVTPGGTMNHYTVAEDPSGTLAGAAGDTAWLAGGTSVWRCGGGTSWTLISNTGASAGARTTVWFQPGGVEDTEAGIYETFADAYAAALASADQGEQVLLVLDGSLESPVQIPSGTWDLTNIQLIGVAGLTGSGGAALTVTDVETLDGCIFTNWFNGLPFCRLSHQGSAALTTFSGTDFQAFRTGERCVILPPATDPVFSCAADSVVVFYIEPYCGWGSIEGGAYEVLEILAGATADVNIGYRGVLYNNSVRGSATGTLNVYRTSASAQYGITQADFAGSATYVQYDPPYEAADAGDWAVSAPTTTWTALDRIAAAVAGLLGAPIP